MDVDTDPAPAGPAAVAGPDPGARLLELVLTEAADVLVPVDPGPLTPDTGFFDVGLVSVTAIELRDRLAERTGLSLPQLLLFDFPTPALVVEHLLTLPADPA